MSGTLARCQTCRAMIDEEDLFCHNCGTECPHRPARDAKKSSVTTHSFRCEGCGASMNYDASAQALRCPFCGAKDLRKEESIRVLQPTLVVPMAVERLQVESILRKYLGSSFWHPGDLSTAAQLQGATPVYVPYWVYSASTHTYYTADSSQTPHGARADWYPIFGERKGDLSGILVSASSVLTPDETRSLLPFDLQNARLPEDVDLENITTEEFRLPRKSARSIAQASIRDIERQHCAALVPGRSRNVHVNVMLSDLTSQPMLLPVWILVYRYRQQVYRVLINGQSGKLVGQAPTSYRKLAAVIAAIALALLAFLALVAAAN